MFSIVYCISEIMISVMFQQKGLKVWTQNLSHPPPPNTHVIESNQDLSTFIPFISMKIIQKPDLL